MLLGWGYTPTSMVTLCDLQFPPGLEMVCTRPPAQQHRVAPLSGNRPPAPPQEGEKGAGAAHR